MNSRRRHYCSQQDSVDSYRNKTPRLACSMFNVKHPVCSMVVAGEDVCCNRMRIQQSKYRCCCLLLLLSIVATTVTTVAIVAIHPSIYRRHQYNKPYRSPESCDSIPSSMSWMADSSRSEGNRVTASGSPSCLPFRNNTKDGTESALSDRPRSFPAALVVSAVAKKILLSAFCLAYR